MIEKIKLEIIMTAMRNQITNRADFLENIKKQALKSRKNVSFDILKKELNEIEKNVLDQKSNYSLEEIEEFETIKNALNQLISEKIKY